MAGRDRLHQVRPGNAVSSVSPGGHRLRTRVGLLAIGLLVGAELNSVVARRAGVQQVPRRDLELPRLERLTRRWAQLEGENTHVDPEGDPTPGRSPVAGSHGGSDGPSDGDQGGGDQRED